MSRRALVWGALLAAVYAAAAWWTSGVMPVRPIFDGLAPPAPYRWVSPPPELSAGNQRPQGIAQSVTLKPGGTDETSVATPDGQATLILPQGSFAAAPGATGVRVEVTPQNPARYGPSPSGLGFAGNAYNISAHLEPSGASAMLAGNVTVLLTYPITATQIATRNGSMWTSIGGTDVPASLQIFAKTRMLGVFVALGHGTRASALRWWTLGVASGVAALLGLVFGLRERRRLGHAGR